MPQPVKEFVTIHTVSLHVSTIVHVCHDLSNVLLGTDHVHVGGLSSTHLAYRVWPSIDGKVTVVTLVHHVGAVYHPVRV